LTTLAHCPALESTFTRRRITGIAKSAFCAKSRKYNCSREPRISRNRKKRVSKMEKPPLPALPIAKNG
jgi:hypothetical protein